MRAGLSLDRVVLAAAELADEAGFNALTVSTLARRLGIRTPSLYTYVDGNADLRIRLAALALDESADRLVAAIGRRPADAALRILADTWRDYARAHPGRYAATRQPVPDSGTPASRSAIAAGRRHADLLRSLTSGLGVPDEQANHAVRLIGSIIHGYVSLELAGAFAHSQPPSDDSWHYAIDRLTDLLAR